MQPVEFVCDQCGAPWSVGTGKCCMCGSPLSFRVSVGGNGIDNDTRFLVMVDRSIDRDQQIIAAAFHGYNPDIHEATFPRNPDLRGEVSQEILVLYHINRNTESREVIKILNENGFRPGTASELIALSMVYSEKQKHFPIVALSSVWHDAQLNCPRVMYTSGHRLNLVSLNNTLLNDKCRFLAVRK